MSESRFVYVTYIRASPEKIWSALLEPEFTRRYWGGAHQESEWRRGARWRMVSEDGRVTDTGEVLEIDPPRKLVLAWRNQYRPELTAEGVSRMTYLIEAMADSTKLTVTHEIDAPASKVIEAVSGGWPLILSGLKSLLETGETLPETMRARKTAGAKA